MKRFTFILLVAAVMVLALAAFGTPRAHAARRHHTANMAWWTHARFGMFIHWGLYAVPAGTWHGRRINGIGEWIMNNADITRSAYAKLAAKFDPVDFNADQWVKMARDAGVRYIVITTKHHDGFCMFRTAATHYNVVQDTPWHKDPMALLAAACKKYGIRFCTYYSVQDWHSRWTLPDHVVNSKPFWQAMRFIPNGGGEHYVHYMQTQVGELIHQYHPGLIWFDNPHAGLNFAAANNRLQSLNIPKTGRNHHFAVLLVALNVAAAVSPLIWGMILQLIGPKQLNIGGVNWNRYSLFFGCGAMLMLPILMMGRHLADHIPGEAVQNADEMPGS